jgi:hypothetical protein
MAEVNCTRDEGGLVSNLDLAQDEPISSASNTEIQDKPALAELGCGAEQRDSLRGDQIRHNEAYGLIGLILEAVCRDRVLQPRRRRLRIVSLIFFRCSRGLPRELGR